MQLKKMSFDEIIKYSNTEEGALFLCKCSSSVFVSELSYDKNYGYYIDNVRGKEAIKLNDLIEICLIIHNS